MRYCNTCGKPIEDGSQFCAHCGSKSIENATALPMQPQPVVPSPQPVAKPSSKKTVVVLSVLCGLLVVTLVVLFFVFIYPSMNKPSGSVDTSTVFPTRVTRITADLDGVLNTTESTTVTTTQTTVATTTTATAPKDLPPVQPHVKNYRVRLTQGVNVRTGAYAESEVIGSLQKDTVVSSTAIQSDWVYVHYGTLEGWVHLSGIVEVTNQLVTPNSNAYSVMQSGRVVTQDGDGVNLRYGPSTTYDIIQSVHERQILYVMYYQDDWYYVEYNGVLGWASSEFVALV